MSARLIPWREWRFEITGFFRDAGYSDQAIRKMDWSEFRRDWTEGWSAREIFDAMMSDAPSTI